MAIPDYQSVMLPLLRLAADGNEHTLREAVEELAEQFKLTEEERKELLPNAEARCLTCRRTGRAASLVLR